MKSFFRHFPCLMFLLAILTIPFHQAAGFSGRPLAAGVAQAQGADQDSSTQEVILPNGFRIVFEQVVYQPDDTSTWHYFVEELPESKDLNHWVLELPLCAPVRSAAPDPWEVVHPDPTTRLVGVRWDVGKEFQQGTFSVTVEGRWQAGTTTVAAKGPYVAYGEITGPVCTQNQAPQAVDDLVATRQDSPLQIPVLNNDFDPDADRLLLADFQPVSDLGGTVTRVDGDTPDDTSDDRLFYVPPAGFIGQDSFTYAASDGYLSDQATVFVTVEAAGPAPIANPDSYTVPEGGLVIPAPGVLENDTVPQDFAAQAILVRSPDHGTLDFNDDGSFTYIPSANFFSVDAFTYQAQVGLAASEPATVTLQVLDQTLPTATWVSPTTAGERYDVSEGELVELEVSATDNQAVSMVRLIRWDAVNGKYVLIADLTAEPYRAVLNANDLNPAWNQMSALAQDAAGNWSDYESIWLYRLDSSGSGPGSAVQLFLPIMGR